MINIGSQNADSTVQPDANSFGWIGELLPDMPTVELLTKELTPELVGELYDGWVKRAAAAINQRAGRISIPEAFEILAMIRSVLDPLEEASERRNERFPDIFAFLQPIDDLVAGLELIVVGSGPSEGGRRREANSA